MKGKGSSPTAGRHGEEKRGTGGARTGHTGQVLRLTRRGTEQGSIQSRALQLLTQSNSFHPSSNFFLLPSLGVRGPVAVLTYKKRNLNQVSSSSTISRNFAICGDATPHVFGRRFRRCRDGERPGARHCCFLGFLPFPITTGDQRCSRWDFVLLTRARYPFRT